MVAIDISDEDFVYEEECLRNPHSVQTWLRYLEHKQDTTFEELNMIYEVESISIFQFFSFGNLQRALKQLPGSYKLWYKYLRERRRQCKGTVHY